jgi:hypothetical protein
MRMSRLAEWVAGGVAGCPGTVDTMAPGDPPPPTSVPPGRAVSVASRSRTQCRRRGPWVTAAAVILVVYDGLLGIVYAPILTGDAWWTFLSVGISALTIVAVLNIATGIGLLRLHGWARWAAVLLSGFGLALKLEPAFSAGVEDGAWFVDWLGIVGSLVVLFAVLRRWPAEQAGAG